MTSPNPESPVTPQAPSPNAAAWSESWSDDPAVVDVCVDAAMEFVDQPCREVIRQGRTQRQSTAA